MPACECCGTPVRRGADKCYVKGCVAYGLSITELDSERDEMLDFLSTITTESR